jgi:hypothetical protein
MRTSCAAVGAEAADVAREPRTAVQVAATPTPIAACVRNRAREEPCPPSVTPAPSSSFQPVALPPNANLRMQHLVRRLAAWDCIKVVPACCFAAQSDMLFNGVSPVLRPLCSGTYLQSSLHSPRQCSSRRPDLPARRTPLHRRRAGWSSCGPSIHSNKMPRPPSRRAANCHHGPSRGEAKRRGTPLRPPLTKEVPLCWFWLD